MHWGLRELVADAELIASELTTNAVQSSRTDLALIRLYVGLYRRRTRVEVWDRSDGKPEPKQAGDDSEGGRGLLMVEALSSDWGWYARPRQGKVVWADLVLPHPSVSHLQPVTNVELLTRVRNGLRRL